MAKPRLATVALVLLCWEKLATAQVTKHMVFYQKYPIEVQFDETRQMAMVTPPDIGGFLKYRTLYDYRTKMIAYKDLAKTECYLERMKDSEGSLKQKLRQIQTQSPASKMRDKPRMLYVSDNNMSSYEVWRLAGSRISGFCRGFPATLLQEMRPHFYGGDVNNALPVEEERQLSQRQIADAFMQRVRRRAKRQTTYTTRGYGRRYRGQTQTQYLAFQNGGNEGKAEAESSPELSRTQVSGTSGMGQAQSQSGDGNGCEGCFPGGAIGYGYVPGAPPQPRAPSEVLGAGVPSVGTQTLGIPGVSVPGVSIPGVGVPGIGAPGAGPPTVGIPTGLPGVGAPGMGPPAVGVPGVGVPPGLPGVGALGVGPPTIGAPGMGVPGVGAPGVGVPGVGAPGVRVPGVGVPGIGVPGVGAPGIGVPGVGAPGVGVPGVGAPGVRVPGVGAPQGVPSVGAPEIGVPVAGAPGLGVPGVGAPGIGIFTGVPGVGVPGVGVPIGVSGISAPGIGPSGVGIPGIGYPVIGVPTGVAGIGAPVGVPSVGTPGISGVGAPISVPSVGVPGIPSVEVPRGISGIGVGTPGVGVGVPVGVGVGVGLGVGVGVPGAGASGVPGVGISGLQGGVPGITGAAPVGVPGAGVPGPPIASVPSTGFPVQVGTYTGAPGVSVPGGVLGVGAPSGIPGVGVPGGAPGIGVPGVGVPAGYLSAGVPGGVPGVGITGGLPVVGVPGGVAGVGVPGGAAGVGLPGGGVGVPAGVAGVGVPGGVPGFGVPGVAGVGVPGGVPVVGLPGGVGGIGVPGGVPGVGFPGGVAGVGVPGGVPGVSVPGGVPGIATPAVTVYQPGPYQQPGTGAPTQVGYPGGIYQEFGGRVYTGQEAYYTAAGDSQAESSVRQEEKEIRAAASAQGKYGEGTAQTQVSGIYSGTGAFSAQAQTSDKDRGAQSQVVGGRDGATSTAQGQAGSGKTQSQVQLGSSNGATTAEAQSGGIYYGANTQVQAGYQGGMADAQAKGQGSTSSQAQIGFTPYQKNGTTNGQKTPFRGGGSASAQGGAYSGQSQSQIQGSFLHGISYTGAAQAGSGQTTYSRTGSSNYEDFGGKLGLVQSGSRNDRPQHGAAPTSTGQQTQYQPFGSLNNNPPSPHTSGHQQTQEYGSIGREVANLPHHIDQDRDYDETTTQPDAYTDTETRSQNRQTSNFGVTRTENDSIQQGGYRVQTQGNRRNDTGHTSIPTQTQHIVLGPLNGRGAYILQASNDQDQYSPGDILQPGQTIHGTPEYTIPKGYRGRITSVAGPQKTTAQGGQSQTVVITPGAGNVTYTDPSVGNYQPPVMSIPVGRQTAEGNYDQSSQTGHPGTGQTQLRNGGQQSHSIRQNGNYFSQRNGRTSRNGNHIKNGQSLNTYHHPTPDSFVTVTKSVTGQLDNGKASGSTGKYTHTYYTKSSTCGYFTFSCNIVFGSNGRTKICRPNPPTTPDGTPCCC